MITVPEQPQRRETAEGCQSDGLIAVDREAFVADDERRHQAGSNDDHGDGVHEKAEGVDDGAPQAQCHCDTDQYLRTAHDVGRSGANFYTVEIAPYPLILSRRQDFVDRPDEQNPGEPQATGQGQG